MSGVAQDEDARLDALHRYRILDTREEGSFARLAEDLARTLHVPIAAVTFVDRERQWFKAVYGLGVRETPRAWSFCAHALDHDAPLVVRDARLDVRFARNPLVRGAPHIRFYAGLRLREPSGRAIGAVCVIDTCPRPEGLTDEEAEHLRTFADRAMAHTEFHLFRLEWLERVPTEVLRQAALASRDGARDEAERLVGLAYAAADRRADWFGRD